MILVLPCCSEWLCITGKRDVRAVHRVFWRVFMVFSSGFLAHGALATNDIAVTYSFSQRSFFMALYKNETSGAGGKTGFYLQR